MAKVVYGYWLDSIASNSVIQRNQPQHPYVAPIATPRMGGTSYPVITQVAGSGGDSRNPEFTVEAECFITRAIQANPVAVAKLLEKHSQLRVDGLHDDVPSVPSLVADYQEAVNEEEEENEETEK